MFALLCIALFAGALANDHERDTSMEDGDINSDWQEVTPGRNRRVPIVDWIDRGFSFRINTNNNANSNIRSLEFVGEAPGYEYLGAMIWNANDVFLYDNDKSRCGITDYIYFSDFPKGNFSGDWHLMFDKGNISISYENEEWARSQNVSNPEDKIMALSASVGPCSGWMPDAEYMIMKRFSDETMNENDYYKYTNDANDANDAPSADMCMRGEFFWQEKCNKCPPGKSTVQEGNTTYNDCVDMRYIQCSPEEDKLECEMNICPCDNYEECDRDMDSTSYGMCKQMSDYIINSARGVAVTTALVAMAFFAL